MLWPVLLRVAVAFPVPEAPPAQIEAVDAIRTLIVYVLPLRGGKTGSTPCGLIIDDIYDTYKVKRTNLSRRIAM